jgi:SAM-dependent methyltransferase
MTNQQRDTLRLISKYYSAKLSQYGPTPQGVDWNGEEGQNLRFETLCKIINTSKEFSINDIGCGYGSLYEFLLKRFQGFSYTGVDISENMIFAAQNTFKENTQANFVNSDRPKEIADFSVASGILNVRLDRTDDEWQIYIEEFLEILNSYSRYGFAFNCLTSYSDQDKKRDYLYYGDPCALFDLCKRRYSRNVALLHDYNLYEFTILVKKTP